MPAITFNSSQSVQANAATRIQQQNQTDGQVRNKGTNASVLQNTTGSQGVHSVGDKALTHFEKIEVKKLKQKDINIKNHEKAHMSKAGIHMKTGAMYTYKLGPDNELYAVHGNVAVDTSTQIRPEETIQKMRIIRQAAIAPINPSPHDLNIAAKASQKIVQANQEIHHKKLEETKSQKLEIEQKIKNAGKSNTAFLSENLDDKHNTNEFNIPKINKKINFNIVAKRIALYTNNLSQYQYNGLNIIV